MSRSTLRLRQWLPLVVVAGLLAGCGSGGPANDGSSGKLRVVAAENFWGSIAAQLGGSKVAVQSIIVNPNTDPHSYEPTAADGVAIAESPMAILNGIGYDAWASKLLDANPSSSRVVLNVGHLLGLKQGDNPHQWYSPSSVRTVINQIVADYKRAEPKDAAYFDQPTDRVRDQRSRSVRPANQRDPLAIRRRAGRLQREHLPAAGASARPEAAHPLQLREGDRGGERRDGGGQRDGRRTGAKPRDQSVDLQQPERPRRTSSRSTRSRGPRTSRSRRSPKRSPRHRRLSSNGRWRNSALSSRRFIRRPAADLDANQTAERDRPRPARGRSARELSFTAMCAGCVMAAAAGASGARSWLQAQHMTWLTPRVLRAMTIALFVVAFGFSSITLSGSAPSQHHNPPPGVTRAR